MEKIERLAIDRPAVVYLLAKRNMRLRHLARTLDVGEGALGHYLRGRCTVPDGFVERLAAALDVAPSVIVVPVNSTVKILPGS